MKRSELIKKYRSMNPKELTSEIGSEKKALNLLILEIAAKKNNNVCLIRKSRKNIARLMTLSRPIEE